MSQKSKGSDASNSDAIACEYYDQCLGFEDVNTVTALCIGILIIVIFLFIASIWHRRSNLEHLQFITSNFYLYFYIICLINFILILVSVKFFSIQVYSQLTVGITLILTSIATMLVNIIGCKYYRSYILMKKCKLRLLKFIGVSSMIIFTLIGCALLYFIQFDRRTKVKIQFTWFLAYMLTAGVIHTSIASLASKLAQLGWIILMVFAVLYVESYWNERYSFNLFLIYWHPIVLCAISVAAVFFFSPFSQLRRIALGIFSCFIAMFDLVTDVNVISVWLLNGHYVWASFQMLFILAGVIFSGYYVKDYYGFVKEEETVSPKDQEMKPRHIAQASGDTNNRKMSFDHDNDSVIMVQDSMISGQTTTEIDLKGGDDDDEIVRKQSSFTYSQKTFSEYIPSNKMQIIGQVFTFIGLGRLWHSILGWDSQQNKDMMIANRILKIWEMIFGMFLFYGFCHQIIK